MGPDQEVMFERERITLDIPKEGVVLESGWTITPHTYPGVSLVCLSMRVGISCIMQLHGQFCFVKNFHYN